MTNKKMYLLEVIAFIIIVIVYFFVSVVPDIKKNMGSSDHYINAKEYSNMIEFNIDGKINFAYVINKDNNVYHILFFSKESTCLYNNGIEGNSISEASNNTFKILMEEEYLKANSKISITKYSDNNYDEIKKSIISSFTKYGINTDILELENTIENKGKELGISSVNDPSVILRFIDMYSKEFINNNSADKDKIEITSSTAKKYTDVVYKKIEKYITSNNIQTLEKNNTKLVITMIPIDDGGKYYPSNNSWYYVESGKIYVYIEVGNNFGYCYNGSIENYNKGECK